MWRETPVVAFLTMKGGVGKTTLAANITRAVAERQSIKILLIDTDSQCNLTQIFRDPTQLDALEAISVYQAFASHKMLGPSELKSNVFSHPPTGSLIDLICGSFSTFGLAVAATETVRDRAAHHFREFMRLAKQEYDLVVLDTNPSATFVTLQALDAANFLVAPITFDSFSMRGVHLITQTLSDRCKWLDNPRRIRIIPNRIPRPHNDRERRRLIEDEQRVRHAFPRLNECITLDRIHESKLLSNKLPKRGFVQDHQVSAFTRGAKSVVVSEFSSMADNLILAMEEAFGAKTSDKEAAIRVVRDQLPSRDGGFVGRP